MRYIYPKILLSFILVLGANFLISTFLLIRLTKTDFEQNLHDHLTSNARAIVEVVRENGRIGESPNPELDALMERIGKEIGIRITVINRNGVVVADSAQDPREMSDHATRPEIVAALSGQTGEDTRISPTLGVKMSYVAVPIVEGGEIVSVVRVALPRDQIVRDIRGVVYVTAIVSTAVGGLIALVLSVFVARMYSRPIELIRNAALRISGGDFKYRLRLKRRDELLHVAEALNDMSSKLGQTFKMLKREKERIAAILSGLNEPVLMLLADGTIYLANETFCRFMNLSQPDLLDREYREVLTDPEICSFIEAASHSSHPENCEMAIEDAGMGLRHYRLSSSPILSKRGRFRGVVIVFHDVSLNKEIEGLRREFLDNASHELKTPLSAILAATETLIEREPGESDRREKFYQAIFDNTTRLHNLISDMLDLSEIEQKKAALEYAPHDLGELVRDVLSEFWPEAGKKNHTLEIKAPPQPIVIETDQKSFGKALGNLVDNAIRYTEPGGRIAIRIAEEPKDEAVRIDVEDTGIGIPPQELDRVFERFYRVDKARSLRSGGTGLGLSIVKHILEALGGRITVRSQPGVGSTFSIHLPLRPKKAVASDDSHSNMGISGSD